MQGTLTILGQVLYGVAFDSDTLGDGVEILYSLLELCQRDRSAEPWKTALHQLRAVPAYQAALAKAKSEGLQQRNELFSDLALPGSTFLQSSTVQSGFPSGVFGGGNGGSSPNPQL